MVLHSCPRQSCRYKAFCSLGIFSLIGTRESSVQHVRGRLSLQWVCEFSHVPTTGLKPCVLGEEKNTRGHDFLCRPVRGMCSVHPHLPWEAPAGVWGNQRNGFCGYLARYVSEMQGFKTTRTERKRWLYRFIPSHLGKQLRSWCWHLQALPWTCCVFVHTCGQTWEVFGDRVMVETLIWVCSVLLVWLSGCAHVQVVPHGCICAVQGGVRKPGAAAALPGVQPPLSCKSNSSCHTWPVVLVGDVCSELFELGKTPNHPEQAFSWCTIDPLCAAPNLCAPTSAWCKSNSSAYFTIQWC